MKLKNIMTKDVAVVSPETSIEEAAKIMQDLNIGSVPVVENSKVKGIVTDRDIVIRCIAEKKNPTIQVSKIMTTGLVYGLPHMNVLEAADLMAQHQVRRLPVVDKGKLVGIISIGDLALEAQFFDETGEALTEISDPTPPIH